MRPQQHCWHPRITTDADEFHVLHFNTQADIMFAPPPVQLTRAEIERRKQWHSAGVDAAARSPAGSGPKTPTPTSSLHRSGSNTSKDVGSPQSGRKGGWLLHRGEKSVTSSLATAVDPGPPPEPPKQHPGDRAASKGSSERPKPKTLSEAFGENPRKAPSPPKRPARPSSDAALVPGAFPSAPLPATPPPQRPVPLVPVLCEIPPPVPDKSPKRVGGARQNHSIDLGKPTATRTLRTEREVRARPRDVDLRVQPVRFSPTAGRVSKTSPTKGGASANRYSRTRPGSVNGKFQRSPTVGRRASAAAYMRAAMSDMEKMRILGPPMPSRRATDSELQTVSETVQPSIEELSWKRRQAGETMSMLLNDGFFPAQEYMYSMKNPNISVQVPFPPPLSLLNKELPDTPSSIVPTPTELYQSSPIKSPRTRVKPRMRAAKRRSPPASLSITSAESNGTRVPPSGLEHDLSPGKLSIIPESSTVSEKTPPSSASRASTPLATRIHLRGGSVITLSPPELTAWKQTCYLQGPIKLPKPTILPRKGSTASMEAFQEVVDQVYQEALNIPRRRSDDQIVDDICEFFDEFCFEALGFAEGVLGVLDVKVDEMEDIVDEIDETGAEIERFATPPHEMGATPVEKVVAKEVVEHTILLAPVDTEETLRARGIARLSGGAPASPTASSRRVSASRKDSTVVPLLPVPETTMLDFRPAPALSGARKTRENVPSNGRPRAAVGMDQGFEWDDVEELDALSSWVAPAALPRKNNMSTSESKNAMKRMRRLVATASAIL